MFVKSNKETIFEFERDASNFKGSCNKVYFPESTADIVSILKSANNNIEKITIAGNGTGVTGAKVPESGSVISTSKLNSIIEIDPINKSATLQPGVLLADFKVATKELGLYYPPDPTEDNCFIGGNVATNASGASTFKFGSTRKFINRLEVILPRGDKLNLSRGQSKCKNGHLEFESDSYNYNLKIPSIKKLNTKNTSGYYCTQNMDAIDLFIGSEGTLGVISEIEIKLLNFPKSFFSCVIFFESECDSLSFIEAIRNISKMSKDSNTSINALSIEFFDRNTLKLLRSNYSKIPESSQAAVWIEQESYESDIDTLLTKYLLEISKNNGDEKNSWFATNNSEREKFKNFRHSPSLIVNDYISKKNLIKVGTDTAVPDKFFLDYYLMMKKLINSKNINYIAFGHAGDSHLHVNMMPANNDEYKIAKDIYLEICKESIRLGGTVSAEHGIGKLKRNFFELMYSKEEIESFVNIKKKLDPNNILGCGNIFYDKYFN